MSIIPFDCSFLAFQYYLVCCYCSLFFVGHDKMNNSKRERANVCVCVYLFIIYKCAQMGKTINIKSFQCYLIHPNYFALDICSGLSLVRVRLLPMLTNQFHTFLIVPFITHLPQYNFILIFFLT